jgi:glycosyltransferase involved in cell wall biosynthesis
VTAVHQFVPALVPRDATGNHALALQQVFRGAGWKSDLYVEAVHADLTDQAAYFEEYPDRAEPGDLLLYHLGTASPLAEFLLARPERLVLDYHNITPASYYEGWADQISEKVALARVEAAALSPRAALGIADSAFNALELRRWGCRTTAVVPVLVGLQAQPRRVDTAELARRQSEHGDATVLLFVGRLSPNKAQHRLVEALWFYRRWYDPEARLHLVGPAVTESYAAAVFAFADELGLADAVRHGHDLTDAQLGAWYADADVFVCLSEHEGFCLPVLEAMHHGLPVVALAAGAVPETVAEAGILVDSSRPSVVAAAARRVSEDPALAAGMVAAGHRRAEDFRPEIVGSRFVEVLGALAGDETYAAPVVA